MTISKVVWGTLLSSLLTMMFTASGTTTTNYRKQLCRGQLDVVEYNVSGPLRMPVTIVDDRAHQKLCHAPPEQIPPCSSEQGNLGFVCETEGTFLCQTDTSIHFIIAKTTTDYDKMDLALESEHGMVIKKLEVLECEVQKSNGTSSEPSTFMTTDQVPPTHNGSATRGPSAAIVIGGLLCVGFIIAVKCWII